MIATDGVIAIDGVIAALGVIRATNGAICAALGVIRATNTNGAIRDGESGAKVSQPQSKIVLGT